MIDGTGAKGFQADVRLSDGLITEVASGLEQQPGETCVDAEGCYVTPGLIESHTHFDGTMWWQPDLEPLPGCGVTTVVMGNCGFALAPLHDDPAVQAEVVKIFSFFEDIPEAPFFSKLPWSWRTWSEYSAAMQEQVKVPTNYGTFVGHIALRLAVDSGGVAETFIGDVSESTTAEAAVKHALESFGQLNALVNAAGVIYRGNAVQTSDQQWRDSMSANVDGSFLRLALATLSLCQI